MARMNGRKAATATTAAPVSESPDTPETLTVESWPIDRLKPYGRNSRTHSPEQVAKIAKSIEQFGFTNPILANEDGTIIAGHGRTLAARRLGMTHVPVIVPKGWTDAQRRAYVILDNKLALDAGWDEDLLKLELGELAEIGLDIAASTGFDEDELDKLFATVKDAKPPDTGEQLDGLAFSVIVRCTSEQQQSELLERFEAEGLKCEALIS